MKKTLFLLAIICTVSSAFAQVPTLDSKKKELADAEAALAATKAKIDAVNAEIVALTPPVIWKKGQSVGISFSSLGLTNWVEGGVSSNALTTFGNVFRNYKKDKVEWVNNLDMVYGFVQNEGDDIQKNSDRIDLLSKFGYAMGPKLNYSTLLNFRSQFAPGFDFSQVPDANGNRTEISKFLAPATVIASTGFDYKVTDFLSLYISPATGKFTIVTDDSIAAARTYIPSDRDENGTLFYSENFRPEFGALFKATLKKDLTDIIAIRSTLDLFNNLTDANKANRRNTDVDWATDINMKLTKFLDAKLFTYVKYDHNQVLEADALLNKGPSTQFQRLIGLGFNYKW